MALVKSAKSPYTTAPITGAYWRIVEVNMNFVDSQGALNVYAYASKADRDAKCANIDQVRLPLGSGRAALDADKKPLIKNVAKDGKVTWKNAAGDVITPTYPEIPKFDDLVDSVVVPPTMPDGSPVVGVPVFDIIKGALYNLLKTQPEFAGAQDDL